MGLGGDFGCSRRPFWGHVGDLGGYLGILKAPVGISAAILGALGDHLGAMLEILGAILGIFELMLDEVGLGNRPSGLRIGICEVFAKKFCGGAGKCWQVLASAGRSGGMARRSVTSSEV